MVPVFFSKNHSKIIMVMVQHVLEMEEISINITNAVLYGASRCGINAAEVIQTIGLDPDELNDPERRVSFDVQMAIWDEATRRSGDRDFGLHLAEAIPAEMFGVVAHVAMACGTLGEALERFIYYSRLINTTNDLKLEGREGRVYLSSRLNCAPWVLPRHIGEWTMGIIWLSMRRMLGPTTSLLEVGFQHPEPEETGEHRRVFGAPVRFKRPANYVMFDSGLLERRFETANPELLHDYTRRAQRMLDRLPEDDPFIDEVRRAIYDSLGSGDLAVQSIARKLDLNVPELRRRLADHGKSFQFLLSAMRRDLAKVYLEDKKWTTMDVAFVLGFSDPAAFTRTFKRWTGQTPGEYRKSIFE